MDNQPNRDDGTASAGGFPHEQQNQNNNFPAPASNSQPSTPPPQNIEPTPTGENLPTPNEVGYLPTSNPSLPSGPSLQQNPQNPYVAPTPNQTYAQYTAQNSPIGMTGTPGPNEKFFSTSAQINNSSKRKKLILLGSGLAVFLLLASAGYVFGYYIPNKPENVWSTGLNRTGEAIAKLTDEALKDENLAKIESTDLSGDLEIKSDTVNFQGSLSLIYDAKKSKGDIRVSSNVNGDQEDKVQIKFLSEIVGDNRFPDVFFNVIGVKDYLSVLGLDNIGKYEGRWISVDNKYIESAIPDISEEQQKNNQITSQDIAEVSRISISVSNEYLFTDDAEKAVLIRKSIVGPEDTDGVKTYHYKAGINKDNLKKYCETYIEQIYSSESARKVFFIADENIDSGKKDDLKYCEELKNEVKDEDEFDLWIDKKYKLLHKIRIYERDTDQRYTEFGQIYDGSDTIKVFVRYKNNDEKQSIELNMDTNFKTFETSGELTFGSFADSESTFEGKLSFKVKPYDQELTIDKPKDAVPLKKILEELGLEDAFNYGGSSDSTSSGNGSIQSRAKDSERQTDINAIHSQLEAYYATNGVYPTFDSLNSKEFRKNNLFGLDEEAVKDPDGTIYGFLSYTATSTQYGYIASPSGCRDDVNITPEESPGVDPPCNTYELTALRSDGSLFTKKSLN